MTNYLSYKELNNIYPYINFKNVHSFFIFKLSHNAFRDSDAIKAILAMGFGAQRINLEFANLNLYSRPIKSFSIEMIEKITQMDASMYTPYYIVINGKE